MFESKKGLKRALLSYALKENFEIRVTRSCTARYEVGCKDPECKFKFRAVKMEDGNYWIVQIFEEDHSCTIDDLHNRYRQASAWLIGEILSPKLAVSGRSLKPKEIMTDMQVEHGDLTSIRPVICIDATHLKGKFGGVMFIAACQDANNQVFPLAYGWGDVECEDSWTWFLKELKKAIGCPMNCIIISDRSPAIKVAMGK
ncbi:hypothetical protein Dsin_021995 [Dipteronia sinensis]|uniref:MULE transposase domain-containing protein n=1 Tax=Dipteronia sinensis TaxID=43782 RepID=A0AAE0DZB1_9ROSI|nr:hypothetical protein Dsin_021995 [Dipteronia sinensis]